ncbi:acetolactate decarboxylase [Pectinatus cerevisiiphilus]|uniref:Alpha-acetolactate decarboxylase n=1 Tax=Pectinatus cerevisiiphilus TaxID=86956 RepID=A0A4R3K4S8_9FIRM|nr:acetolactate decarboxylase [Pectinatus cerevisiiphilus]TCS77769.1 acetolactate decarboxylase [Pectinatus cerevisiiphilus]
MNAKSRLYGEIYQVSTMSALLDGVYDGVLNHAQLAVHGNFGIGTFDHLDGELIGFDGNFYHLRDGLATPMEDLDTTPFCTVTYFNPQIKYSYNKPATKSDFEKILKNLVPSENLFYAICIEGTFKKVSTRTVSYQKEYVPMTKAINAQQTIEFENVKGKIVGFWTPFYAQGIAVAGYHFHFIDDELKRGGHVFDYVTDSVNISIDQKSHMNLYTPDAKSFLEAKLSRDDLMNEIKITEG